MFVDRNTGLTGNHSSVNFEGNDELNYRRPRRTLSKAEEALGILDKYDKLGIPVSLQTYVTVLQAICRMEDLEVGQRVHKHILQNRLGENIYLINNLLRMYINCGSIMDARELFNKVREKDVVTWTTMIGGFAQHGHGEEAFKAFHQMQQEGLKPNKVTYMSILNICLSPAGLEWGKEIHAHIIAAGLESDVRVGTEIVKMYVKGGSIRDARQAFNKILNRDVFVSTVMIGAYTQSGNTDDAFEVFLQMQREGLEPNKITYLSILNSSANSIGGMEWVKEVHAQASKAGLDSDVRVANALINTYARSGNLEDACLVFEKMGERDIISWNVMIAAYASSGHGKNAFEVFSRMLQGGFDPDVITFLNILNPCASQGALEWVKEVHVQALVSGLNSDVRVMTALVKMYAKCGSIRDARQVFDNMVTRNIVTWNVMIGAYSESGHGDKALEAFLHMQEKEGLEPNAVTYLSILNPSASLGALKWVKEVHTQALKGGFGSDVRVNNALINMYAKSGSIDDARHVFKDMVERDIITWNVMIGALAQHGCGQEALDVFNKMKIEGVKPNEVTFVGILSACSHAGLVDECRRHFSSLMQDQHGIKPTIKHYSCMVDVLGRAGRLCEAQEVIKNMPFEADTRVWGALLSACRVHGNVALAEHAAEHCLKLNPHDPGVYVLLSNVYAAAGMPNSTELVRRTMKEKGVTKEPGCSWVEVDNKVHSFIVEDRSHPQADEIYCELARLVEDIKRAGYVPDTRFVTHNVVDERQREQSVLSHSEKLAITYGLMSTPAGTPIRIFKNLRVCSDCHTASKFISKVSKREIVARDANRFHHFKDGVCSCGDYW